MELNNITRKIYGKTHLTADISVYGLISTGMVHKLMSVFSGIAHLYLIPYSENSTIVDHQQSCDSGQYFIRRLRMYLNDQLQEPTEKEKQPWGLGYNLNINSILKDGKLK